MLTVGRVVFFFFFNDTATTEIYTLSLHDALPIYVNNAIDVASFGPVMRLRAEAWRHTIDSHVTTFLLGAQRAARLMEGGNGVIVAISSLGSRTYVRDYAPIGVGKAAIEALTRYLAME